MCRLLGYCSRGSASVAGLLTQEGLGAFTALSHFHCDGWGMAWYDADGPQVRKSPHRAAEEPEYARLAERALGDLGLVHLRWATPGLGIGYPNSHPFRFGPYTFAHNGAVHPQDRLGEMLPAEWEGRLAGTTDSERYLLHIMWRLEERRGDLIAAIADTVASIAERYAVNSLNAVLLSPAKMYVISWHDPARIPADELRKRGLASTPEEIAGYFHLACLATQDAVVAASSGWPQPGWTMLPNNTVLVVERVTLRRSAFSLEPASRSPAGRLPVPARQERSYMGCPAQRSTAAAAISGLTATNVAARTRAADGWRAPRRGTVLGPFAVLVSVVLSACGSSPTMAPGTASVVSAPVRIAHTRLGAIGYRVVGSGPPLVLIMGYAGTMEVWDPRLVHALAQHNRVVMFDNAGVGRTKPLPGERTATLTIGAMADQTSALIDTLGLGRPDVLGWSMGGMIAQALAVLHPAQVRRLVLCATYPGTGTVVPSQAAIQTGSLFPANQAGADHAFTAAISEYPAAPAAPADAKTAQAAAVTKWWDGTDATGRKIASISVPTLIADGTDDQLNPVANDHTLAHLIPGSRLMLYADAGHGFLFQEGTRFAALIESFLTGHPIS